MPPKASAVKAQGRKRSSNEAQSTAEKASVAQPSAGAAAAMMDEGPEESSGSDRSSSPVAATPSSKKVKLAPAAAAAAAAASSSSCSSSAAASASPPSLPTPCAYLDTDSLSVVYSFLDANDFLHAVRVSRHWRSARVKKSAWPAFSLDSMIGLLRDDDFDNPQRRKLQLSIKAGERKLASFLRRPGVMELWRHVTEIKLVHAACVAGGDPEAPAKAMRASVAMLSLIPRFASLAALTLDGFNVANGANGPAIQLFDALSSRLLMLGLFRCGREFEWPLRQLSSLRVLVLGWIPEAGALLPMHQLVYLHVQHHSSDREDSWPGERLGHAIRWLSVHQQLRSLSVEGFAEDDLQLCLFALLSCDPHQDSDLVSRNLGLHGQPQLDLTVPCALTELAIPDCTPAMLPLLNSLPSLTRLQTFGRSHYSLQPALRLTLPRLQQLRLQGDAAFSNWDQLVQCTALRIVHLTQHRSGGMARATLQTLLRAWAATLEECRLGLKIKWEAEESQSNNPWPALAACRRLRILDLRMEKDQVVPAGLVSALQGLPSFQTLVLRSDGAEICPLPSNLLSVMARSNSFSTLHLHSPPDSPRAPDYLQSAEVAEGRGLSAMLSALAENEPALLTAQTINRLRVVGHRSVNETSEVHSYRVVLTDSHPQWEQEY